MDNHNTTIAYYAGALGLVYAIFHWNWNLFVMALAIHFVLISIFSVYREELTIDRGQI